MPKRYVAGWSLLTYFAIPAILGLLAYYLTANSYIATFYLFLIIFGFITSGMSPERIGIYAYGYSPKTKGSSVFINVSWGILTFFATLAIVFWFKSSILPSLPFQSITGFLLPQADIGDLIGTYFAVYAAPATSFVLKGALGALVVYFIAFAEEIAFRGPMFMITNDFFDRKYGFFGSIINSIIWGAVFAFFHILRDWYASGMPTFVVKPEVFYTIFLIGIIWGLARVWTQSLITTITAHFIWDFLAMNNILFILWAR